MPRVSVIVPIFNGLSFLRAFFESLEAALPPGSELILVDDGSTEPVFDAVPDFAATDDVIRLMNDRNLGYSVAVNRGFAAATGDVIVQLNTDLLLDRNCITSMIELIEREKNVGVVGSKLIYPTTGLVQHVGMAFGNHSRTRVYAELPSEHPLCRRTRALQIVVGATVATTRAALEMLGPLDETYFNQCEDLDHCMRAVELGLRNFVCADSVAYHWMSKSGPARFAQVKASDALFWSRWGGRYVVDLGKFVDEALDHLLDEAPELEAWPFDILDLSRGANESLVLERLHRRWPQTRARTHRFRQTNNPGDRLWLPLALPHWLPSQPRPFIYLVDGHRELEDNFSWFETRRGVVEDELIVDLNAAALRTSDLPVRR